MCAAPVRVIDCKDIAGINVLAELFQDGFALKVQRAHMEREVRAALHDGIALGIAESGRKVTRIDDKGITGSQDLFAHEVNARGEGIFEYFERYWIQA
jgi:hypothetical protein